MPDVALEKEGELDLKKKKKKHLKILYCYNKNILKCGKPFYFHSIGYF